MNDLIKRLNDGSYSVDDVTDDDLRQLVIYYATILRGYSNATGDRLASVTPVGQTIINTWDSWPAELFERFRQMILTNDGNRTEKEAFWKRPADTNIKFGVKITVETVDTAA